MTPRLAASALITSLALAMGFAACSSGGDVPNVPAEATVLLDREDVRLTAYINTEQNVSLQILNRGRAPLTVSGLRLELADGGTLPANSVFTQPIVAIDAGSASDPLPIVIGGLGTGFLQFTYAPKSPGKSQAQLVVESNAPARPQVVVPVHGCATLADGGGANCACPADAGADSGC